MVVGQWGCLVVCDWGQVLNPVKSVDKRMLVPEIYTGLCFDLGAKYGVDFWLKSWLSGSDGCWTNELLTPDCASDDRH